MVHLGFRGFEARIVALPDPLLNYGSDPDSVPFHQPHLSM